MSANDEPAWSDEAIARLLGACDGYIHGIVAVKLAIGRINYRPIDKRHVRKIAQRDAVLAPLRELLGRLDADLRSAQEGYQMQLARRKLIMEGK